MSTQIHVIKILKSHHQSVKIIIIITRSWHISRTVVLFSLLEDIFECMIEKNRWKKKPLTTKFMDLVKKCTSIKRPTKNLLGNSDNGNGSWFKSCAIYKYRLVQASASQLTFCDSKLHVPFIIVCHVRFK